MGDCACLPVIDRVPLVVPIAPNPARDVLIETLRSVGRSWRIRFESVGLAGVEAALCAGLGVCVGPRSMQFLGAAALPDGHGLPLLPDVEFVMVGPDPARTDPVLRAFAQVLRRATSIRFELLYPLPSTAKYRETRLWEVGPVQGFTAARLPSASLSFVTHLLLHHRGFLGWSVQRLLLRFVDSVRELCGIGRFFRLRPELQSGDRL